MPERTTVQGRRAPVQERSRATVSSIRQAAARILRDEGYERATTNRIAQVAGVSIGTLYQYFDGREAVFDALIEDVLEQVVTAATLALDQPEEVPLDTKLEGLARAVLRVLVGHPGVVRQLDAIPGSTFRARLADAKARVRALLASVLELHAEELGLADPALAARLLADLGEGVVYNLQADDDADRLGREAVRLVTAYLRA